MDYTQEYLTIEVDEDTSRTALCTLASVNISKFKSPEELERPIRLLVRGLHNILQYQNFLNVGAKLATEEFEPIGISITNFAHWMAQRGFKYGQPEALQEQKRWMEYFAYFAIRASCDLAKEKGPCKLSHTTLYGKGIFPWERRATGVNELADFTPNPDIPWEELRQDLLKYGVRNALWGCQPPVESSSVVVSSTNGIEPTKQLITLKESKAGIVPVVVPDYKTLADKYQNLWDIDPLDYLKHVAVFQVYYDQSLSANTAYNPAHYYTDDPETDGKIPKTKVISDMMQFHIWGGKTMYYYLINKSAIRKRLDSNPETPVSVENLLLEEEAECEACKL